MSKEETKVTIPLEYYNKMVNKAQLLDSLVWNERVDLDDLRIYEDDTDYQIPIDNLYPVDDLY